MKMERNFEFGDYGFFAQWEDRGQGLPGTVIYCHEGDDPEELRRLWRIIRGEKTDGEAVDSGEGQAYPDTGETQAEPSGEDPAEMPGMPGNTAVPDLLLVSIARVDWDKNLSPWPATRAGKGRADFSGGADDYLAVLQENIKKVEASLVEEFCKTCTAASGESVQTGAVSGESGQTGAVPGEPAGPTEDPESPSWPVKRGIAGYSLGGLFAVYCFYRTDFFQLLGSMSGSLWFDKFKKFMAERRLKTVPEKAYFSLGDAEPLVKNQRMAAVGECTETAVRVFTEKGARTVFEWNEGGHFNGIQERVAKGLRWLAE